MDRLLRRVREALAGVSRVPRPEPAAEPLAPPAGGDLFERFRRELERAGGRLVELAPDASVDDFLARTWPGARIVRSGDGMDGAEVGVDRADALLAETGTILKSYADRESSRASLVPPVSVFLARRADLVPGLPEALARVAPLHRAGPAYSLLITGPSRTADIEKELVIPAHGPRELVVVFVA